MSSVMILDCTLRDGGYINQWGFGNDAIGNIISSLADANIDVIECGFLKDIAYSPDAALYSCVSQITPLITPKKRNTLYVAMIALGDISPDKILPCDGSSIDGIRLTFHKHEWNEARDVAVKLIEKGYKVFIQPVGTTAYSDQELLDLICSVNELQPFAFYLVDTLGILYQHDLHRFFYLIDHNLDRSIHVGFHSHNNLQMSFANAQELMRMRGTRTIIIDTSVYGMGRGVGNLSTELLSEYLNVNMGTTYSIAPLLSIVDKHLMSIYAEQRWGYDLPYFLSATAKCHPNYATYLMKKSTLDLADIAKILSLLPVDRRNLFDPKLIEEIYLAVQNCRIDDRCALNFVRDTVSGRSVLVLAPGKSLQTHHREIADYIKENDPYIVSTNFIPDDLKADMLFISNRKRLDMLRQAMDQVDCTVATSNLIRDLPEQVHFINYAAYLGEGSAIDNAGAMLIRMLKAAGAADIALAGFDGFDVNSDSNYCISAYKQLMERAEVEQKNLEIGTQLKLAAEQIPCKFITPTRYRI